MPQINGGCYVCTYQCKYCDSDLHNSDIRPQIETSGGVFVCQDEVLKTMGKNIIGERMCFELSSKALLPNLT